jgi:pimeloyl-ACP methyl ester carboxylesterase
MAAKAIKKIGVGIVALIAVLALAVLIFRSPDIPAKELVPLYTNADSRFLPLDGMEVHYRDVGPRSDSFPLILIHGTASSLHTWDSIVKRFPDKRCISMDLPGFGLTGPNPKRTYDASSYNAFLHSFLKALKVDSPIVAGNSLGGFIAWNYAAGHPAVKALVLLDPAGFPLGSQNSNLGFRIARIPVLNQLLKYITPKSIVRKSAEQSYGNKRLVNDALVDRYFSLTLREGNRQALIDRLSKEADVDTSQLDKIQMPTLIIWGELDQVVPFSHLDNFKRHLHHASIATYQGVGHVPMEEAPDSVSLTLRKWMPLATGSMQ